MDVDPSASMRIWAVDMDLGPDAGVFEFPALPAADWFPVLISGDVMDVLDLITEAPAIEDMMIAGLVSAKTLIDALNHVVEQVTGRSVHATTVLTNIANLQWPVIGGDLARRGFRWDQVPIGAALDAIYVTVVGRLKPEALDKFQALLDNPPQPAGTERTRARHPDRSKAMRDFENMAGPKPEPVRSNGSRSSGEPPRTPPRYQPAPQDAV